MIKVLLADDSPLVKAILNDIFNTAADIFVVGETANGSEAVAMAATLKPDIIIMDLMMPVMDGLEAIEVIMAETPVPILVLSATLNEKEIDRAFTAIKKGALDVMDKPDRATEANMDCFASTLIEKVRLLAGIKVIHHHRRKKNKSEPSPAIQMNSGGNRRILAIGASTGGPKAVMSIIKSLPAHFKGCVFIVQHIANGFAGGFASWLDRECAIQVRLAVDGDELRPGVALVAPNDFHMTLAAGKIKLATAPPVNCCRPSIDVFFNSLAEEYAKSVVSVLLTGMGKDGAQGLLRLRERGGATIVQDEESCSVFGMPKAAIGMAAADEILPLDAIPGAIARLFANKGL